MFIQLGFWGVEHLHITCSINRFLVALTNSMRLAKQLRTVGFKSEGEEYGLLRHRDTH